MSGTLIYMKNFIEDIYKLFGLKEMSYTTQSIKLSMSLCSALSGHYTKAFSIFVHVTQIKSIQFEVNLTGMFKTLANTVRMSRYT